MTSLLKANVNKTSNKHKLTPLRKYVDENTMFMFKQATSTSKLNIKQLRALTMGNYLIKTKMLSEQQKVEASETQEMPKNVKNKNDTISGSHHAAKIIAKLREAKLSDKNVKISQMIKPINKLLNDRKKIGQPRKLHIPSEKEYYPDKVRRKVCLKKDFLRPKPEYRVVATTNKRKRTIPVKEVVSPPSPAPSEQPAAPALSLSELVAAAEARGLDDEDLMEILTCPSPVWWEDDEEEEFRFSLQDIDADAATDHQNAILQEKDQKSRTDTNGNIDEENASKVEKHNTSTPNKFVDKQSKLEKLLNSIKNKNSIPIKVNDDDTKILNGEDNDVDDEFNEPKTDDQVEMNYEFNKEYESRDQNVQNEESIELTDQIEAEHNDNEISDQVINELNSSNDKDRKDSVSGLSDCSINDELINTLENIEIPVKQTDKEDISESTSDDLEMSQNEINIDEVTVSDKINLVDNKEPAKRRRGLKTNEVNCVNNYEFIRHRTRKPNRKYEFDWSPEKKSRPKNEVAKNEIVTAKKVVKGKNELINHSVKEKAKITEDVKTKSPPSKKSKKVTEIKTYKAKNSKEVTAKKTIAIPPDLPPLTINPFKNKPKVYASPKSLELSKSNIELDSISDTNIKFLDEYTDKSEPKEEVSVNKGKDGELVTVYQIVTNNNPDTFEDIESQIKVNLVDQWVHPEASKSNSQINSFYKTRKRAKSNKKTN